MQKYMEKNAMFTMAKFVELELIFPWFWRNVLLVQFLKRITW